MNGQKCFELTSETKTGWQTASEDNGPREKYNNNGGTKSRLDDRGANGAFVLTWHRWRWFSVAGGIQRALVGHGHVVHGIQVASHGLQGDVGGLHPGCQCVGQYSQSCRGGKKKILLDIGGTTSNFDRLKSHNNVDESLMLTLINAPIFLIKISV